MNIIDTEVDMQMKVLGYICLSLWIVIALTIVIYHNIFPNTLVAMGISIIISGFITVAVMHISDKRKNIG